MDISKIMKDTYTEEEKEKLKEKHRRLKQVSEEIKKLMKKEAVVKEVKEDETILFQSIKFINHHINSMGG